MSGGIGVDLYDRGAEFAKSLGVETGSREIDGLVTGVQINRGGGYSGGALAVRGALYVVLLVVLFVGTFVAKQAVYGYSRRKQQNGTAGPMTRRLFGQPGQDAWLHMNRAGFAVMAVFITVAVVLFDQWGGGIYSGTTHAVILVAGMAVIVGIRLVRWDRTGQNH